MVKRRESNFKDFATILALIFVALPVIYFLNLQISGFFPFGPANSTDVWWNDTWHYRVKFELDANGYSRQDWPVDINLNFTYMLEGTGIFNENSTRLFEYNSTGGVMYEVPHQFDRDNAFSSNNEIGTLSFLMNGSTPSNGKRFFYLYFDSMENGYKAPASYSTDLARSWDGEEVNVNNTLLQVWIDTLRGENTSGIYQIKGWREPLGFADIFDPLVGPNDRTFEYIQYSNGTYNFSFDLRNNATFPITGPIKIVIEQKGNETIWNNPDNQTGEGMMTKRYTFYSKTPWFYIEQNFTSLASYSITRNSTPVGALTFDVTRTGLDYIDSPEGNSTDPFSWHWARNQYGDYHLGTINVNETNTLDYFSSNDSSLGKIGIQLNDLSVPTGSYITEKAAIHINGTQANVNNIKDLRNRLANNVIVIQKNQEIVTAYINPQTNATVYNRNETAQIVANITYDPYSLVNKTNATIDMGTAGIGDDQTIILNYNGTDGNGNKIFVNELNISNSATTGQWKFNATTYDKDNIFLNRTEGVFNVTNMFSVNTTIANPGGLTGRIVYGNVTVKNYANTYWIAAASMSCEYNPGAVPVTNITDEGSGNYSLNFTAPVGVGTYTLNCTASKNNNTGWETEIFYAESDKTYINISTNPFGYTSNTITMDNGDSFVFSSNATNTGQSNAYSANKSLALPPGWSANSTSEICGDIVSGAWCIKGFNVSMPSATQNGTYNVTINTTWRNPDNSLNFTTKNFTVTVNPNPKMNVLENLVSGLVADSTEKQIGNFTINSTGNSQLSNVTFYVNGLSGFTVEFTPSNISSLAHNTTQNVSINVTVPVDYTPGIYNGTVNVSASNDGWDNFTLSITVPNTTSVNISTQPVSYTSSNVTFDSGESFALSSNATNIGDAIAKRANISLSLPFGWSANSTIENCNNISISSACTKGFNISIPAATSPATFYVNFTANWTNPDGTLGTNTTNMTVTVNPNPKLEVLETGISDSMNAGSQKTVGSFNVNSTGNSNLTSITFNVTGLSGMTVTFNPSNIATLGPNNNRTVSVTVNAPLSTSAGVYNGTINVSASNDGWDTVNLTITILENRTWSMSPMSCNSLGWPDIGTACEVNVTNLGNIYTNFTISPSEVNYTKPNVTSFSVPAFSTYTFKITYNLTGIPKGYYYSKYTIDANQSNANPDNATLNVTLVPYSPPTVNITMGSTGIEQLDYIDIFANITDTSGTNISWARTNVTRPNGTVDSANMSLLTVNGSSQTWYVRYPSAGFGNTSLKGNYSVAVYSSDLTGAIGNATSSFIVSPKLTVFVSTLSSSYVQGDSGSILYSALDTNNQGIGGVRATFTITNPNSSMVYNSSFTTQINGNIEPMPQFGLSSDAMLGTYTMLVMSNYTDPSTNITTAKNTTKTFEVTSRTSGGLFADIETTVNWFPNNIMKYAILVHNAAGQPVDPDTMNLTVYDPANNQYLTVVKSQMTKQATGLYNYQYAMPANTAVGMYLAVLNANYTSFSTTAIKSFRVSQGGPFDVKVNPLEFQTYQDDFFDFQLIASNMGEVTQDVYINYTVTSSNGTVYYSSTESVLSTAHQNMSLIRNVYVFPAQPLGMYNLNVKVTYSYEQPSATADTSFNVIGRPKVSPPPSQSVTPPAPPTTGLATTPSATYNVTLSNITIIQYKENISLARGWINTESVVVKNTGEENLQNLTLVLIGLPSTWYEVTPSIVDNLQTSGTSIFLIKFTIPKTANISSYRADMLAMTAKASDQKRITLNIYQSTEDVIAAEISRLKTDLAKLKEDTDLVEKAGKDVKSVLTLIEQANKEVSAAEDALGKKVYDAALDNVANADSMIAKARDMLNQILAEKPPAAFVFTNMWLFIAIVIIAASIGTYVVVSRSRGVREAAKPLEARKILEVIRARSTSKSNLMEEKNKLERSLQLLDKELKGGMINYTVYNEMKSSLEEKLRDVESHIKGMK